MSISASLEFASNLAAGALRDADAVDRLVASLGALGAAGGGGPLDGAAKDAEKFALALAKTQIKAEALAQAMLGVQGLKGSQAQDLAAQKANAAAELAGQKGAQAAVLAAQKAQAQLDALAVRGEQSAAAADAKAAARKDALAAASAAQQNAALAKLVLQQAKASDDIVKIKAQEEAKIAVIEAKAEADAAKRADKEVKAAAKAAEDAAKAKADATHGESYDGRDAFGRFTDSLGGAEGIAGSIAKEIAAIVEKVASIARDLIAAGLQLSIDSGTFKENTMLAFEGLLGSETKAGALYEKALDLADKVGLSKEAVVAKLQKQISAGVSEADALKEVNAIAAATLGLGEGKASKIDSLLTKIQASDKVSSRVFESLGVTGLASNDLFAKLEKQTGKTRKELELLAKAGKLASDQVAEAIEGVIDDKFGSLRDKAGQTIPRIMGDIKDEFARLFDQVTGTAGAGKFKGLLSGISDMLTGSEGAKLKSAFNELFGNLFGMIGGAVDLGDASQLVTTIAAGIRRVGQFVKDITPAVDGFAHGLAKGFSQFIPIMSAAARAFMALIGAAGGSEGVWETVGRGVGFLVGFLVLLVEVIAEVVGAVVGFVSALAAGFFAVLGLWSELLSAIGDGLEWIWNALTGSGDAVTSSANEMGGNIMSSMASGIASRAGAVADAVVSAASNAIAAAKRILGIASPSKVFAEIGSFTAAGFAGGIDSAANDVVVSARTMAADAAAASAAVGMMGPVGGLGGAGAANANGAGPGAANGRAPIMMNFGPNSVVIHASSEAGGREAARGFFDEIRALAEQAS